MGAVKTSLTPENLPHATLARLAQSNRDFSTAFPGEASRRQPVHTVYGGAHLFKARTCQRSGEVALDVMRTYAPDPVTFARALGLSFASALPDDAAAIKDAPVGSPGYLARVVHERVLEKLAREPVEDFRIDFEDGYGNRTDAEEDGHAVAAAEQVAEAVASGTAPPFLGIRIKPLNEELRARSVRTLDLFVTTLVTRMGGRLPEGFVVTLPKITVPEQVEALVALLEALEAALALPPKSLLFEVMVETTQSIFLPDGRVALPHLMALAKGRCTGAHFGTYDYTAGCSITAAHQHMAHPACDFAKHVMKVALAGTAVMLSDGATNVMPIGPHRAAEGAALGAAELAENRAVVHRAWRLAHDHIRHSLVTGFYQGWDLHPAQLPARYGAVYAFFLEGLEAAGARLKAFLDKAAQATLLGDVFDDAATGQGLLNYFLRAIACGALTEAEAEQMTGLGSADFATRSFVKILAARKG
ncbi:phosphoenolpyruvate kinase [Polyangium sp. rjm3]|uniref:Phosphoenolpyruvate kinase n=1 Tax=Polyangium mundeleinium TaxID=2995306 RepID=A0ABT5EKN6_9BACT|nr:phosphoenolpyruvate kinase [Polyangium mundeleinium]